MLESLPLELIDNERFFRGKETGVEKWTFKNMSYVALFLSILFTICDPSKVDVNFLGGSRKKCPQFSGFSSAPVAPFLSAKI